MARILVAALVCASLPATTLLGSGFVLCMDDGGRATIEAASQDGTCQGRSHTGGPIAPAQLTRGCAGASTHCENCVDLPMNPGAAIAPARVLSSAKLGTLAMPSQGITLTLASASPSDVDARHKVPVAPFSAGSLSVLRI